MYPEIRARLARALAWLLALAVTIVGTVMTVNPQQVVWTEDPDSVDRWLSSVVDVGGIGLALLCTGLVLVSVLLIVEAYFWRAPPWTRSLGGEGTSAVD